MRCMLQGCRLQGCRLRVAGCKGPRVLVRSATLETVVLLYFEGSKFACLRRFGSAGAQNHVTVATNNAQKSQSGNAPRIGGLTPRGGVPPPCPSPDPLHRVSDSYEAEKPHIRRGVGGLKLKCSLLRRLCLGTCHLRLPGDATSQSTISYELFWEDAPGWSPTAALGLDTRLPTGVQRCGAPSRDNSAGSVSCGLCIPPG